MTLPLPKTQYIKAGVHGDVRVTVKFRNNLLLSAIERAGYKSLAELARKMGVNYQDVTKFVGMKTPARRKRSRDKGEWKKLALEIATFLHVEPEKMFSWWQQYNSLDKNEHVIGSFSSEDRVISLDEVKSIIEDTAESSNPETQLLTKELRTTLISAVDNLTPRMKQVMQMRYGLNDNNGEMSQAEVADELGVSRTRIWGLEVQALKRLRANIRRHHILDGNKIGDLRDYLNKA
jgi:RNA polymerase sigma factor (sigma-70 family)